MALPHIFTTQYFSQYLHCKIHRIAYSHLHESLNHVYMQTFQYYHEMVLNNDRIFSEYEMYRLRRF